jgi:hypothetical protein
MKIVYYNFSIPIMYKTAIIESYVSLNTLLLFWYTNNVFKKLLLTKK